MDSQRKKEKTEVNISECMCVCFCMLYPSQQLNICSLRSCMCHCPVTLTLSAVFCHFVFAPAAVCVYVCNWMCLCVRLRCHICLSVHLCTWLTLLGCLCTSLLPCLCDPFITVVGCALLNPIQKKISFSFFDCLYIALHWGIDKAGLQKLSVFTRREDLMHHCQTFHPFYFNSCLKFKGLMNRGLVKKWMFLAWCGS